MAEKNYPAGKGERYEGLWRLISPADDPASAAPLEGHSIEVLAHVAAQTGAPFSVDEKNRKVYFGNAPKPAVPGRDLTEKEVVPRAPGATALASKPSTVSIKDRMKPGDVHLVADRKGRTVSAFGYDGKKLWSLPIRLEGVAGGTLESPRWNVTNGDTPPGVWKVVRPEKIPASDPDARAYGWWYLWLAPVDGAAAKIGDVGIGVHGGGSGLPDPWAARQGWTRTHGCLRMQNEDLDKTVVPLLKKTQAAGHTMWLSTLV